MKGMNGKSSHCREMSRAAGAKKPSESQKRQKPLWAMKAAKDREEEYYDPARKDNIWEGTRHGWSCGKGTFKTDS